MDTQRHREEHHVKAGTEIGPRWPQAKEGQELPEAGRDEDESSPRTFLFF